MKVENFQEESLSRLDTSIETFLHQFDKEIQIIAFSTHFGNGNHCAILIYKK